MHYVASTKENKLEFIQALRGIAALAVVFLHAGGHLRGPIDNKLSPILAHGYLGVDLFFIVSGFIMVYITRNADSSPTYFRNFFIKRITRIWPVYFIITMLSCILHSHSFFNYAFQIKLLKSLLFITRRPVLTTGWTLTYEIYFYLLFGVCILFKNFRWHVFISIIVFTLIVIPWWKTKYPFEHEPTYIFIISFHGIWELVIGVLIGLIYNSKFRIKNVLLLRRILLGMGLFFFWRFFQKAPTPAGIDSWGGVLALFFFMLALLNKERELKIPKIMIGLGNISYSLYLIHLPVQWAMYLYFKQKVPNFTGTFTYLLLTTIVSIILAIISYYYLEKRMSNRIRDYLLNVPWNRAYSLKPKFT